MNFEERRSICFHRIERGKETLHEARLLFSDELKFGTINRIYYALFYSVSALAMAYEFTTSKHTGLQGWFNKTFGRDETVGKELVNLYNKAYQYRSKGDYTDFPEVELEILQQMLQEAEPFINKMEELTIQKLTIR